MKRIKKILAAMLIVSLTAMIFAGCGDSNKLGGSFDEETVKKQAQEDINTAQNGSYEEWQARFTEALRPSITEDIYTQYHEILKQLGEFKEFGKIAVAGKENEGKNYAIAIVIAKYEKKNAQYTISYDEDMGLMDFFIK